MFIINKFIMLNIIENKNSLKFDFGDGTFQIFPKKKVIALADTSDMVSFKLLSSRKTIFAVKNSEIIPHGDDANATVELLSELL